MKTRFIQVQINAPTEEEADKIQDVLLKKHLIAGTCIMPSHSKFWWKGKINCEDYIIIYGFSLTKHKKAIIDEVRKHHSDEVPGIIFWSIDANEDFLEWITKNTK